MSPQQKPSRGSDRWSASWIRITLVILATALSGLPTAAQAALSCAAQTGAVAFGSYQSSAGLNTDSSGYVEVKCSCSGIDCVAFTYTIEIDSGVSGTITDRRMRKSGQSSGGLKYSLFRDAVRSMPFGQGTDKQSVLYLLTLFGTWQRTAVYGRIPASQVVPVGSYSDAPGVTITY